MMNKYEIPNKIKVGGQEINIIILDRCDDNCLGMSKVAEGRIEIATMYNKDSVVSESCQMKSLYSIFNCKITQVSIYFWDIGEFIRIYISFFLFLSRYSNHNK